MTSYDLDVLVIGGGGSAGFTAATTAMKLVERVGMVESGRLGGLCILAGCMPSKTLLHSAAQVAARQVRGAQAYPQVHQYTRSVVDYLAGHREEAVAAKLQQGLGLYRGKARFLDPHTVEVDGQKISAAGIVIATGSREQVPPVPGLEDSGYLTSDGFMRLEELPASLLVLGGGTMAVELAQFAVRMGVQTTLVQRSEHLMSSEDPRLGHILAEALRDEGAQVHTGADLLEVERTEQGVAARFQAGEEELKVEAQTLLLALGRAPNSQGLDLEAAGVETGPKGAVKVNQYAQTSQEHIFAGGDVTGGPMVVNRAIVQGRAAGLGASGKRLEEVNETLMPRAVFSDPQFARVGLSHDEATAKGLDFVEADYDLGEMAVAKTYPTPLKGYMSMRADKATKKIIGADLVAPEASLMIHDVAVAMSLGGTPGDLAGLAYIHPCLSEITQFTAGRLAKKLGK